MAAGRSQHASQRLDARSLEPMLATNEALPPGDGLGLRDQVGRRPRARLRRAAGRLRIAARRGDRRHRPLPGAGARSPRRSRRRAAILDGEIVAFDDEGNPELPPPPAADGRSSDPRPDPARAGRDAGHLRRLRPALARRPLAARRALRGAPRAARRARLRRPELAGAGAPPRRRRGVARGGPRSAASRASSRSGSAAPTGPGAAARDWVKVQNRRRQELVIGGWMPGEGLRSEAGRLAAGRLLGRDPEEAERSAARSGSSTPAASAPASPRRRSTTLADGPRAARRETSPFERRLGPGGQVRRAGRERGGLRWVEPELVCEVEFLRWTHEDTLRAASFKGLRDDKDPREVVREASQSAQAFRFARTDEKGVSRVVSRY